MVQVAVPIDLVTAVSARANVFAGATPMRVATLLELAIARVLGRHAPRDRRERALGVAVAGLRDGTFRLHVDGRFVTDPEAVVVCSGSATLRFFTHRPAIRSTGE